LLISTHEDHSIIHQCGLLQHDVEPKRIAEAGDEELNLLWLGNWWIMAWERHESFGEFIDRPCVM
jgi:hypothetical protein